MFAAGESRENRVRERPCMDIHRFDATPFIRMRGGNLGSHCCPSHDVTMAAAEVYKCGGLARRALGNGSRDVVTSCYQR